MRRHKFSLPGVALITAGLIVGGCAYESPQEAGEAEPLRARVAMVEKQEQPQLVELQGSVEAGSASTISARVLATVTALHAEVGQAVRKGQLLASIDPQVAEGQVSQAQGALAQAQAAEALAKRNFERYQGLLETKAASQLEVDMARTQYERARGAVEQAKGAVAAASSVAADSRVSAPFAGRVAQRLVDVGDLAAPGRPLFVVESAQGRRLRVAVPESVMARAALAVGDALPVAIDSRPDLGRLTGSVIERTPGADPMSHSYVVKVSLPLADLATGTSGRTWIPSGQREVVSVPSEAVLTYGGLNYVVLRDAAGKTSSRVVTEGDAIGASAVEILSGLDGGETVLLGLDSLPEAGRPVQAVERVPAEEGGSR
jgi:RND family efflux transporter MFP subunit